MTKREPQNRESSSQPTPHCHGCGAGPTPPTGRRPYVPPAVVYEGDLETMAVVCDSAFAGFGNCRIAAVPTCIRITT